MGNQQAGSCCNWIGSNRAGLTQWRIGNTWITEGDGSTQKNINFEPQLRVYENPRWTLLTSSLAWMHFIDLSGAASPR